MFLPTLMVAQDATPAGTLAELGRQLDVCLSRSPLPTGSQVTIVFMMKRDGSIFGKPQITFSHLEGDAEARRRFVDDAEHAIDSCMPLKVTRALGAAIAGRMFSVRLGRQKPAPRA